MPLDESYLWVQPHVMQSVLNLRTSPLGAHTHTFSRPSRTGGPVFLKSRGSPPYVDTIRVESASSADPPLCVYCRLLVGAQSIISTASSSE